MCANAPMDCACADPDFPVYSAAGDTLYFSLPPALRMRSGPPQCQRDWTAIWSTCCPWAKNEQGADELCRRARDAGVCAKNRGVLLWLVIKSEARHVKTLARK